jgi:hypothetical protein
MPEPRIPPLPVAQLEQEHAQAGLTDEEIERVRNSERG